MKTTFGTHSHFNTRKKRKLKEEKKETGGKGKGVSYGESKSSRVIFISNEFALSPLLSQVHSVRCKETKYTFKMKIQVVMFCVTLLALQCSGQNANGPQTFDSTETKDTQNGVLRNVRYVTINGVRQKNSALSSPKVHESGEEDVGRAEPVTDLSSSVKTQQRQQRQSAESRQILQIDEDNKNYIGKMANQLFLAKKHLPILSDYQKHILSQDPLVQKYVFGTQDQSGQARTLAPQARALSVEPVPNVQVKFNSPTISSSPSPLASRLVPVREPAPFAKTSASSTSAKKLKRPTARSALSNDFSYVTLPPSSLFGYHDLTPKVQLLQSPQPLLYYDWTSQKAQVPSLSVPSLPTLSPLQSQPSLQTLKTSFDTSSPALKASFDTSPTFHHHQNDYTHANEDADGHKPAKYEFVYNVKDHEKNNHFGHMESRSDDRTYGYYFVQLPDGRLETVNYWADKTGYHANVEYRGRALHPPTHTH